MNTQEVQQGRVEFWQKITEIDPNKLVFIDESGFWIGMSRTVARAPEGQRVYDLREFYRGKKVSLIGAIKLTGLVATRMIAGSMQGDDFEAFVKTDLVPKLEVGDVVVMDNLNSHHRATVVEAIESANASVLYMPTYSPEFNPIEMMWSQLKSIVRMFRTRTIEALIGVIEMAISLVDAQFFKNWFTKCCYCTE